MGGQNLGKERHQLEMLLQGGKTPAHKHSKIRTHLSLVSDAKELVSSRLEDLAGAKLREVLVRLGKRACSGLRQHRASSCDIIWVRFGRSLLKPLLVRAAGTSISS